MLSASVREPSHDPAARGFPERVAPARPPGL